MPLMSRRRLQRLTALCHPALDICCGNLAIDSQFPRETSDKFSILRRCPTSQPVVEMTSNHVRKTSRHQQMQQRYGVSTAGNPYQPLLAASSSSEPWDFFDEKHAPVLPVISRRDKSQFCFTSPPPSSNTELRPITKPPNLLRK